MTRTHTHAYNYSHESHDTHTHTRIQLNPESCHLLKSLKSFMILVRRCERNTRKKKGCGYKVIYGVAMTIRLLKITGLFCKTALQKRIYSAIETYNFKVPTKSWPFHIWKVAHVGKVRWTTCLSGRGGYIRVSYDLERLFSWWVL